MHLRIRLLTALGMGVLAFGINSAIVEAKDQNLFKVICDVSAFTYSQPDVDSARMGDTTGGTEYKVYKQVDDVNGMTDFYCIRRNGKYVYVPTLTFTKTDIYTKGTTPAEKINTVTFVSLAGNIKNGAYEELIEYYLLLPLEIREMFQIEGFTIRMTEQSILDEAYEGYAPWTGGALNGVTDYEKKMIYINDENARYIVHEMGHYVNNRLDNFANRPENNCLYISEASKVSYYSTNNREYFCECFDQYFRCPELLKQTSPLSYDLVDRAVKEFKVMSTPILDAYWGRS